MKKRFIALLAAASLAINGGVAIAEHKPGQMPGHQSGAGTAVESMHADVKKHRSCAHCGMDREKFAHSRMLVTYSDGTSAGVCSIHCAVTELQAGKSKLSRTVEVADLNTKKLVDAEKAFWVTGGGKKGVMTRTAKWAFEKKYDADVFIKLNGGKPATYKEAFALAEKD